MSTAILILAAGASSRMGTPKQLLSYKDGSLLGHVVHEALEADCGPVYIVLGAHAEAIRSAMTPCAAQFVYNAAWAAGIGASIAAGVTAIRDAIPAATAVMVLLGDQPLITAARIREFVQEAQAAPDRIVAASYDGTIGVPAVFPAAFFPELQRLDSAKGAKPLLERHAADIRRIALVANPDIDTPEDYAAWINAETRRIRTDLAG